MEVKGNHNDFLKFQSHRNVILMAKNFLIILEELRDENLISIESYSKFRAKILGQANDISRELSTIIDQFEIFLPTK